MRTDPFPPPEPSLDGPDDELVTVVIPARDEERSIGACLDSVLVQDQSNLQVVVIDGSSVDRTREIVRRYALRDPRVELVENPTPTISGSLNLGLAEARGRWLVRVDAHSSVPPGYVRTLVGHLRTGRWGGVGGRKDGVGATRTGRAIAAAMASPFGVGGSRYHYATRPQTVDHVPFGAYPTSLLRELGGWDERLPANEDYELDYRIRRTGRPLLLDPAVAIAWRCQQSIGDLFRQYRRYGRGKARVASLHPSSLKLRHVGPPALVAAWTAAVPLAVWWPWILAAAILPYALALAIGAAVTAPKAGRSANRRAIPLAFLAMHVGWGIGFWHGVWDVAGALLRRSRPR
jgi:succinoglycan biosynthesis protein ExoA